MSEQMRTHADDDQAEGSLLGSMPNILWQRRWLVLIPAVLIAVAAIAAAFLLPRSYRSSAVLLVESQNLPDAPAANDDPIDRRMAKIRQQILSRPDLVELIQANDLYGASAHREPLSDLVERMRDATDIRAIDADIQRASPGAAGTGSIAFSLSFDYPAAAQSQIVAQTFVDRLLKLDATQSQAEAQNNVNFLSDQEQSLQRQIAEIETRMNRLAGTNGQALSSASVAMMTGGAGIDYAGQIAALQRENATLRSQQGSAVERDPNVAAAESQLAAVKALYTDSHPDVRLAETRLAAARDAAKGQQTRSTSALIQQQIATNNSAIQQLQSQRSGEQSRASMLAAAQARGPQIAQEVQQLSSRAESIRANLSRVQAQLLNARSVSKLAEEQRGERLTLIDPPVAPDQPTSPNRPLLIAGGIIGGLVVGLGLALLVELIFRPIRSAGQLAGVLGEAPLAVVPVLSGRGGSGKGRRGGLLGRLMRRFRSPRGRRVAQAG